MTNSTAQQQLRLRPASIDDAELPKSRDYERGAKVMVRNDLKDKLDECMEKLTYHVGKQRDYDGWVQVLSANPEASLDVDLDDWLFYFSKN